MNLHFFTREDVPEYILKTLGDVQLGAKGFGFYRVPMGAKADPELAKRAQAAVAVFVGREPCDELVFITVGRNLYRNGFGIAGAEITRDFVLVYA